MRCSKRSQSRVQSCHFPSTIDGRSSHVGARSSLFTRARGLDGRVPYAVWYSLEESRKSALSLKKVCSDTHTCRLRGHFSGSLSIEIRIQTSRHITPTLDNIRIGGLRWNSHRLIGIE